MSKVARTSRSRRPLLLWLLVLWFAALAAASFWRATTLWQTKSLLVELGSTLSAPAVTLLVILYAFCGVALAIAAWGLWQRRDWGRVTARAMIVFYMIVVQAYTWLYVRTGLLWERRWVALGLALLTCSIVGGTLTWQKTRQWLGLRSQGHSIE
jgi:hypothetical protein